MLPNPARRFHEKKFISHSGGVQKMDNHKQIFGSTRTCQDRFLILKYLFILKYFFFNRNNLGESARNKDWLKKDSLKKQRKKTDLQKVMQGNNKTEVKLQPHINYTGTSNLYKLNFFIKK